MKNLKKVLAFALAMIMAFSMLSVAVFAEDVNEEIVVEEGVPMTPLEDAEFHLIDPAIIESIENQISDMQGKVEEATGKLNNLTEWFKSIIETLKTWAEDFVKFIEDTFANF